MSTKLVQKREELAAKQKALASIFAEAGEDIDLMQVKSMIGDSKARAAEVKRLNDELSALGAEVDELATLERTAQSTKAAGERMAAPAGGMVHPGEGAMLETRKSLGRLFIESKAYTGFTGRQGPSAVVPIEMKTLMTTIAGWAPESVRMPGYVPSAQRTPRITDIIPVGRTNQAAVIYMAESTFTNNAAERAEGANDAGEAALVLTPTTANVREIAVWLPVTKEQMEDAVQVEGYVNNRLGLMIRQRLSSQLLAGNGVAPNLEGLLVNATVQTQAKGTDTTPDAVYKAMTRVRTVGFAEPNAAVFHPNDWQDIRLLRTTDGIYIWGSPSEVGPERIWGLTVIQDTAETENTGLVGDFAAGCELVMRQDVTFEVTDSHAGLFIQRTLAVLAFVRAAFPVYSPLSFCTVTGI